MTTEDKQAGIFFNVLCIVALSIGSCLGLVYEVSIGVCMLMSVVLGGFCVNFVYLLGKIDQ